MKFTDARFAKTDSLDHWIGVLSRLKWAGEACLEVQRQPGLAARRILLTMRRRMKNPPTSVGVDRAKDPGMLAVTFVVRDRSQFHQTILRVRCVGTPQ